MDSSVKERLKSFIRFKKITTSEFCSSIGVSSAYVSSHNTFRPKFKGVDGNSREIVHLTWGELMGLLDWKAPAGKSYLERVRDVFCFCCFTGLRYSDVARLSRSDIRDGALFLVTQKTEDFIKIELNKFSAAILEKYADFPFHGGRALPVISNAKMNEYLKELGLLAGLSAPQRIVYFMGNQRHEVVVPKYAVLSTHAGRRTFVVNALYLGIPAEVIMRWTGHSDFKSMKPYVKIVDDLKAQEMEKFNRVSSSGPVAQVPHSENGDQNGGAV